MPGMAKKKQTGNQPAPKKEDRPPHKMVRVPLEHHKRMKALARRHDRAIATEIKVALEFYMKHHGLEPPPKPEEDED
jgi:hypothetical protein